MWPLALAITNEGKPVLVAGWYQADTDKRDISVYRIDGEKLVDLGLPPYDDGLSRYLEAFAVLPDGRPIVVYQEYPDPLHYETFSTIWESGTRWYAPEPVFPLINSLEARLTASYPALAFGANGERYLALSYAVLVGEGFYQDIVLRWAPEDPAPY